MSPGGQSRASTRNTRVGLSFCLCFSDRAKVSFALYPADRNCLCEPLSRCLNGRINFTEHKPSAFCSGGDFAGKRTKGDSLARLRIGERRPPIARKSIHNFGTETYCFFVFAWRKAPRFRRLQSTECRTVVMRSPAKKQGSQLAPLRSAATMKGSLFPISRFPDFPTAAAQQHGTNAGNGRRAICPCPRRCVAHRSGMPVHACACTYTAISARRRLSHGRPTLRADLPQQNDKILLKRIAAQAAAIRFFAANGKQKQNCSHCIHMFFLVFWRRVWYYWLYKSYKWEMREKNEATHSQRKRRVDGARG